MIWAQYVGRVGYEQTEKNKEINEKRAKEGSRYFWPVIFGRIKSDP